MLPVLLGSLTLKRVNGEREEILRVAMIYFKDYLKRCDHYQLASYTDPDISEEENKSVDTKSKKPVSHNAEYSFCATGTFSISFI